MTESEIAVLEQVAERNDGHCDRCHQTIKIYRHKPNAHHAKMLRRMAKQVDEQQRSGMDFSLANRVNFNDIAGEFSEKSQRTKMRQHGLIAKVKEDGKHVANTWLITNKGYDFLAGRAIPETVVIYDNQVLGHEGGAVTIHRLLDEPSVYHDEAISTDEAAVYGNAREAKKLSVTADYRGRDDRIKRLGVTHDLKTDRLQVGKSINVYVTGLDKPVTYQDIAAFQRDWKVAS